MQVDCTLNHATCERFGVRGYPTLIFLHQGRVFRYSVGVFLSLTDAAVHSFSQLTSASLPTLNARAPAMWPLCEPLQSVAMHLRPLKKRLPPRRSFLYVAALSPSRTNGNLQRNLNFRTVFLPVSLLHASDLGGQV